MRINNDDLPLMFCTTTIQPGDMLVSKIAGVVLVLSNLQRPWDENESEIVKRSGRVKWEMTLIQTQTNDIIQTAYDEEDMVSLWEIYRDGILIFDPNNHFNKLFA